MYPTRNCSDWRTQLSFIWSLQSLVGNSPPNQDIPGENGYPMCLYYNYYKCQICKLHRYHAFLKLSYSLHHVTRSACRPHFIIYYLSQCHWCRPNMANWGYTASFHKKEYSLETYNIQHFLAQAFKFCIIFYKMFAEKCDRGIKTDMI